MCRLLYKEEASLIPIQKRQIRLVYCQNDLAIGHFFSKEKKEEVIHQNEETLKQLFLQVFSNSSWTLEDETQAIQLLDSTQIPVSALSLFTSSVMLSLMKCFDLRKLWWLFQALQSPIIPVSL